MMLRPGDLHYEINTRIPDIKFFVVHLLSR